MTFREGITTAAMCLGLGLVLTAWGLASAVIVPVENLYRRLNHDV